MKEQLGQRIWLDSSHTFDSGLNTGIQRVVRNLIAHLPAIAKDHGVQCEPVVLREKVFHRLDQYKSRWGTESYQTWKRSSPHSALRRLKAKFYFTLQSLVRIATRNRSQVSMKTNDLLILPDGYWAFEGIWPHVRRVRQSGVKVCAILYDLIPIQHPTFFPEKGYSRFVEYVDRLIRDVDVVACISQSVENDFRTYAEKRSIAIRTVVTPEVISFRLGSDLSQDIDDRSPIHVTDIPDDSVPFLLQVGTIEPRKNHTTVLDAMDRLWERNKRLRCVFVGRQGWLNEAVLQRVEHHVQKDRLLFLFQGLADESLQQLYRQCSVVICPSFAEGFGLPIVEGLRFGKPVVASDIPIHREVGKEWCEYFDPNDSIALATKIESILSSPRATALDSEFRPVPITWRESVAELFAKLR